MENNSDNTTMVHKENDALKWHCDIYCRKIRYVDCEGKPNIDANAPKLCPYFDEMLY